MTPTRTDLVMSVRYPPETQVTLRSGTPWWEVRLYVSTGAERVPGPHPRAIREHQYGWSPHPPVAARRPPRRSEPTPWSRLPLRDQGVAYVRQNFPPRTDPDGQPLRIRGVQGGLRRITAHKDGYVTTANGTYSCHRHVARGGRGAGGRAYSRSGKRVEPP